jgi:hypothetical protein
LTLPVGSSTYDVDPNNFQATCPSGYSVLGTGFSAGIGSVSFVIAYGTFVGGFIYNDSSIPVTGVYLQAICGRVPAGSTGANAADLASPEATYHARLRQANAPPRATIACVHGIIGGKGKCLQRGEYCARRYERQYERYGFTCSKRDRRGRWHLQ